MPKVPKPLTLSWTQHSGQKMRSYGLSQARVRRIMHSPERVEDGIAPKTTAFMQPVGNGKHELWVMVEDRKGVRFVISAWRYPGRTKPRSLAAIGLLREELSAYAKAVQPVREEKKAVAKQKFSRTKWSKKDRPRSSAIDYND
jgi:hypothetical protein